MRLLRKPALFAVLAFAFVMAAAPQRVRANEVGECSIAFRSFQLTGLWILPGPPWVALDNIHIHFSYASFYGHSSMFGPLYGTYTEMLFCPLSWSDLCMFVPGLCRDGEGQSSNENGGIPLKGNALSVVGHMVGWVANHEVHKKLIFWGIESEEDE